MKIKVEDKKRIKEFVEKQRKLCKDLNIYPIAELRLGEGIEFVFYELDKMTPEERGGNVKPTGRI